eukprot:7880726-Alexandrium_andersonii.AAC.1
MVVLAMLMLILCLSRSWLVPAMFFSSAMVSLGVNAGIAVEVGVGHGGAVLDGTIVRAGCVGVAGPLGLDRADS